MAEEPFMDRATRRAREGLYFNGYVVMALGALMVLFAIQRRELKFLAVAAFCFAGALLCRRMSLAARRDREFWESDTPIRHMSEEAEEKGAAAHPTD